MKLNIRIRRVVLRKPSNNNNKEEEKTKPNKSRRMKRTTQQNNNNVVFVGTGMLECVCVWLFRAIILTILSQMDGWTIYKPQCCKRQHIIVHHSRVCLCVFFSTRSSFRNVSDFIHLFIGWFVMFASIFIIGNCLCHLIEFKFQRVWLSLLLFFPFVVAFLISFQLVAMCLVELVLECVFHTWREFIYSFLQKKRQKSATFIYTSRR